MLDFYKKSAQALKPRLLAAQGHLLDAIAYETKLVASVEDAEGREKANARVAGWWKALGGSDAALHEWQSVPTPNPKSDDVEWKDPEKPIASFELPDMNGRKWRLADLKGKVVFASVWASWCGPCKEELPFVQKLHQKLKGRSDVVVLSLNVDSNPGLITSFLKENQLSIPVLPALSFVQDMLGSLSIPRSWIIDKRGKLVAEQIGFAPGTEWVAQAMSAIERVKRGESIVSKN
jgi:thiol-disulfide isomerase/thioredoxin